MKRKLQSIGGSLYLSIPSKWTHRYNLDKGSEVNLSFLESGGINISSIELVEEEKKSVIEYDRFLFRNLMAQYLRGIKIIKIKSKKDFSNTQRDQIISYVGRLLNLEVIEETSNEITIHNFKSDIPIKKMISRMFYLTKGMLSDLTKKDSLDVIIQRDKLVGKFYLAIIMQQRELLTKKWDGELTFIEIMDLRLLIQRIELIGDEIKHLAKKVLSGSVSIKQEDILFLVDKYDLAFRSYVKQDIESAQLFWDLEKSDRKKVSHNEHLLKIYDHIKDITDLVI